MKNDRGYMAGVTAVLVTAASILAPGCARHAPAAAPAHKKIQLAAIVFQEDQFFRLVQLGMKEAADKAGADLMVGNSNNKPEKEFELVSAYAGRNVDVLLISPLSRSGSATALKLARDRGVKVVTYNTPVDGDLAATFIEYDPSALGRQVGRAAHAFIAGTLGGKARVAILAFRSQLAEQSDGRVNGFKQELSDLPGVEYVAEQDAWLTETSVKKTGDILTAHPDLDVLYSANEGGAVGAVLAVKNAGKAGHVAVFGVACGEQVLEFLRSPDHIMQASTGLLSTDLGRLAVENALKVLRGEPVAKKISVPSLLLSRDDPAGLEAFAKDLRAAIERAAK